MWVIVERVTEASLPSQRPYPGSARKGGGANIFDPQFDRRTGKQVVVDGNRRQKADRCTLDPLAVECLKEAFTVPIECRIDIADRYPNAGYHDDLPL